MLVVAEIISVDELRILAHNLFIDMVKAVVDVENNLLVIDAELHADMEAFLLENGSRQENLWGINLYPDNDWINLIEFDSMINIRPKQGNMSRSIEDENIQNTIKEIIFNKIQKA